MAIKVRRRFRGLSRCRQKGDVLGLSALLLLVVGGTFGAAYSYREDLMAASPVLRKTVEKLKQELDILPDIFSDAVAKAEDDAPSEPLPRIAEYEDDDDEEDWDEEDDDEETDDGDDSRLADAGDDELTEEDETPVQTEPISPLPRRTTFYDAELALAGSAAHTPATRRTYEGMLTRLLDVGDFGDFSTAFAEKIRLAAPQLIGSGKLKYALYKNADIMSQAVDISLLTRYCGESVLKEVLQEKNGREFFEWLLKDKERPLHVLMSNVVMVETPPSAMPYAIKTLYSIWKDCPVQDRSRYVNLAVACSLVDEEMAKRAGSLRKSDAKWLSIQEIFAYFREQDSHNRLLADMRKLTVEQLLYVVDLRTVRSEIDWVNKKLSYKRGTWGNTLGLVRYRMDRAAHHVDPYTDYSFADIIKQGGICADQAYFCATTAKCMGIPAVVASGDGDRGAHAWVVLSVSDSKWTTVNSIGYKTGHFMHPCRRVSCHENTLLSQGKRDEAKWSAAADSLLLALYLVEEGCPQVARAGARYVTTSYPQLQLGWETLVAVMEEMGPEGVKKQEWKLLYKDLKHMEDKVEELRKLADKVQDEHLLKNSFVGTKKRAIRHADRELQREMGDDRDDMVVESVERMAKVLVEAKDYYGLSQLYRKELKTYASRGDIFGQLMDQYAHCMEELSADQSEWERMAHVTETLVNKYIVTSTGDLFKLKKEVALQKKLADYMEKAGNHRRAESLRSRAEKRQKKLEDTIKVEKETIRKQKKEEKEKKLEQKKAEREQKKAEREKKKE